jgi:hypothetical protein
MTPNLKANNLVYNIPASSTNALTRQYRQSYFDQRTYDSQRTARCVLNTGSNFINCFNSSLVIKLRVDSDATDYVSFGNGSAYNLIKNVRIFSKSGVELCNVLNANLNRVVEDQMTKSQEWFNTVGDLMGYAPSQDNNIDDAGIREYVIPLSLVAPVFNPLGKQQMPPQLASGLIVEIDLESPVTSFVRTTGTTADYTIEDIYFNLDSTTMNDMTVGTINDIAAKSLLQWAYVDVYNSRITQNSGNSILSTSINRSVSFADHIVALIQNQSRVVDAGQDSFIVPYSEAPSSYQYTLGSIQLPSNQEVEGEVQTRFQALSTYSKLQEEDNIVSKVTGPLFRDLMAPKTTSFSRNQLISLSQIAISSARSLRLEVNYDAAPVVAQVCNVYLHYVKILDVSISDSKVSY